VGPSRENSQDTSDPPVKRAARAAGKCLVGQQPPTLFTSVYLLNNIFFIKINFRKINFKKVN